MPPHKLSHLLVNCQLLIILSSNIFTILQTLICFKMLHILMFYFETYECHAINRSLHQSTRRKLVITTTRSD